MKPDNQPKLESDALRVLVFSADVGAGHDALARAWMREHRERVPDAEMQLCNGLEAMGPRTHRFVRDGYAHGLERAPWAWELIFRLGGCRTAALFTWLLLPLAYGRRLRRVIEQAQPDLVVSTYPLCTAVLAGLRRRGGLTVPLYAPISDIAPNRMWFAPGVDLHIVASSMDVERARRTLPWARVIHSVPRLSADFHAPDANERGHHTAPHVLVSGGSWGAGDITGLVDCLLQTRPTWRIEVVCGRNVELNSALGRRCETNLHVHGFVHDMPARMRAADVLVATGPGMTIFEAQACELPIVLGGVIPGHGRCSAAAAESDGAARWARRLIDLTPCVEAALAPRHVAPASRRRRMTERRRARRDLRPATRPARPRRAIVVATATAVAVFGFTGAAPLSAFAHGVRSAAHVVRHIPS